MISSKGGGGAHSKKLHRAEGGANIFGVFRVNNIFSYFRGGAGCTPPWIRPCILNIIYILQLSMQSVPVTTDIVSSNFDEGEVYNIM